MASVMTSRALEVDVDQRGAGLNRSLSGLQVQQGGFILLCCSKCYDSHLTILFCLAGGTASGKTTVCDQIMQRLHDQCVVMLSQDCFYRGLTEQERKNVKGQ